MRKITILEHISLDGVIQAPGGPEEDRDGGFAFGGWAHPFDDAAVSEVIDAVQSGEYDLLLGRRTYDIWSGYWPQTEGPMADQFNRATKYVATRRPDSLGWGPAEVLGPDLAADVRRIKAAGGPPLIVWGSSALASVLISEGLADEVILLVFPVLIGTGKRLFPEGTPPTELKPVRTQTGASGVTINTYVPAGPMRIGSYM